MATPLLDVRDQMTAFASRHGELRAVALGERGHQVADVEQWRGHGAFSATGAD